jgi:hypothetical protein
MDALRKASRDRIIIGGLWLVHSPDLNLSDFYLRETVKQNVCRSNTHAPEGLKGNIQREVLCISQEELHAEQNREHF